MIIVAICALGSSVDAEVASFAKDTGLAPYDARARLMQTPPIIVTRTADREAALRLLASLRSRNHDAVACDDAQVPEPIPVRSLADLPPIANVQLVIRATCSIRTETMTTVHERKFRPGMALATGGIILSKSITREETTIALDRQEALYILLREGGPPRVVTERGTSYASLTNAAPTQRENFLRVAADLQSRVPIWDERLLALRNVDEPREIDLRVQLVAISLARRERA